MAARSGSLVGCRRRVRCWWRCRAGSTRRSPHACSPSRATRSFGSHMNLVHLDGVEHGCCGPAARADAEAVARDRRLPVRDRRPVRGVRRDGDRRLRRRARGRTHPEPVRACNGEIKFGAFLRRADELGIDFVATGHYVRTRRETTTDAWHLLRGADACEGPDLHAAHAGPGPAVAVAVPGRRPCRRPRPARTRSGSGCRWRRKPDSQELCFAPSGDAGGFVRSTAPAARARAGRGRRPRRHGARRARRDVRVHGRPAARARRRDRRARVRARRRRRGQPRGGRAAGAAVATRARRRPRVVGGGRAARPTGRSRPRCGSATGATTCRRSSSPRRRAASAWSSASPSARSRPGRAWWSTAATSCSAAAASSSRSAERVAARRRRSLRLSSELPGSCPRRSRLP